MTQKKSPTGKSTGVRRQLAELVERLGSFGIDPHGSPVGGYLVELLHPGVLTVTGFRDCRCPGCYPKSAKETCVVCHVHGMEGELVLCYRHLLTTLQNFKKRGGKDSVVSFEKSP